MRYMIKVLQVFTVLLALILIVSFFFAVIGKMPWLTFWILLAVIAVVAYFILPRVTKIIAKY